MSAPGPALLALDAAALRERFGRQAFAVRHLLAGHPLFALPRLVALARRLPAARLEYNAGDVPITLDPKRAPGEDTKTNASGSCMAR